MNGFEKEYTLHVRVYEYIYYDKVCTKQRNKINGR